MKNISFTKFKKNTFFLGVFLSLIFLQFSCKQTKEKKINHPIVKTEDVSSSKILTANNLLEFVLSTSFDFTPYNKKQIRTLLDHVENDEALVKVYIESDGTGTLGWIKIDFKNQKVYDVTIDPENPKLLSFDSEKLITLRKELISGNYISKDETQKNKSNENLLIKWDPSNSLLLEKLDENKIILNEKFNEYEDIFVYRLPKLNVSYTPIIISGCYQSGHCEEFLLTLDKQGNEISRLKIFYNTAPDGNEEDYTSCIYEIYNDYKIKLTLEEHFSNSKVSKTLKYYHISDNGVIEK